LNIALIIAVHHRCIIVGLARQRTLVFQLQRFMFGLCIESWRPVMVRIHVTSVVQVHHGSIVVRLAWKRPLIFHIRMLLLELAFIKWLEGFHRLFCC
jgi:hypothetical protein